MNHAREAAPSGVILCAVLLFLSEPAQAYVDPGTGSYFLQLAVAGFFGTAFALKVYWKRFKTFLGRYSR